MTLCTGYEAGHSKQASFPFTNDVTVDFVAAAGNKLWKELVGTEVVVKVTSVSLSFTGIEEAEHGQQSIEGFLKRRREDTEDDEALKLSESSDPVALSSPLCPEISLTSHSNLQLPSFTCDRCHKQIFPTTPFERELQLATLRLEHDDFHFAQDLAKELEVNTLSQTKQPSKNKPKPLSKNKPKSKPKPGPSGIESFFIRKVSRMLSTHFWAKVWF